MKFLFVNMTSCSISLAPIPERHAGLGGRWLTSDDLDAIARLDFLCDDIGLDTMNTGVALAVAMDAGIIPFGDTQAAIETVAFVAEEQRWGGSSAMGRMPWASIWGIPGSPR